MDDRTQLLAELDLLLQQVNVLADQQTVLLAKVRDLEIENGVLRFQLTEKQQAVGASGGSEDEAV